MQVLFKIFNEMKKGNYSKLCNIYTVNFDCASYSALYVYNNKTKTTINVTYLASLRRRARSTRSCLASR